jgi:hypothetical protein
MNDKKAYEAFRVRKFANPHPALQQQQQQQQTSAQGFSQSTVPPVQQLQGAPSTMDEDTLAAASSAAAAAHVQQQPHLPQAQQAQQQRIVSQQQQQQSLMLSKQQQQQQVVPDQERVIIHFDVDCFYCQVNCYRCCCFSCLTSVALKGFSRSKCLVVESLNLISSWPKSPCQQFQQTVAWVLGSAAQKVMFAACARLWIVLCAVGRGYG